MTRKIEMMKKILVMEKDYEDGLSKEDMKEKKTANDRGIPPELRILKNKIDVTTSIFLFN